MIFSKKLIEIIDNKDLSDRIIDVADNGASPSGKAPGFGPGIRRFESFRPRILIPC